MACVNEQTVQDLVLGRLQGGELDGVERHVAECSSCAELIAEVAGRTGSRSPRAEVARPRMSLVSKPSIGVGTVVGRFVVVDFLGAGGMGEVYAAYDPNLERKVAIKFLRAEFLGPGKQEVAAERMRREARLVAKLSHPNVVTVYEIDVFEDRLFIAMEYVDGQSAAEWLKAERRAARDVVRVFLAAGAGLAAAHAAGVIHRDFKPHNVMLTAAGEVRVMDFGLAQLDAETEAPPGRPSEAPLAIAAGAAPPSESSAEREARLTRTGTLLGTPAYMAPEQLAGKKATARSDQYSFCVALHEGLFGHRPSGPLGPRSRITGRMQPLETAQPARSTPGWIRRALRRGLALDPAERYPSMDDLLADLRADKARRRRLALALVAGAAVVAGGAWTAVHEQTARRLRHCRANVATAAAVWPFEAATADAVPAGPPAAMWAAFERSGVPEAADIFARVSRTLSTYLGQWANQATDACEATEVRHEQSRAELALRTSCLDERLSAARALTDTLVRADAKVVTRASDAALGLPDLDRCANLVLLRAVEPPRGAARQAEVARLRRRMAEIKLLEQTGHFEAITSDVKTLEQEIRALAYPPLLVDFLFMLQNDLENSGVPTEQAGYVREALRVAERAGYEEGIANALLAVAWSGYRNPAVAELALDQADAVVHHLGDPTTLRAWIENDMTLSLWGRAQFAEAVEHAERSLALKQQRKPPDARDVAISESNLCLIRITSGETRRALTHCDHALELIVWALGWNHPIAMNMAENRALALVELGRVGEGCPLAERVRAFFEGRGERIDGRSTLLATLGRCAIAEARPDLARQLLERSLADATKNGATAMETAEIEWLLARAVYATGDHQRGVDLAERAAKRYGALPELAFRERDVRAWLAARRERGR
jgi:tetratricopeptide (TPR) repeat protein